MALTVLAVLSGALQALGYWLYERSTLRHETKPNAATWFMFSYGTVLLGILEYSRDADWELLILPIVCATLSTGVAFICWKKGTLRWPRDWQDRLAFLTDIVLTICYAGAWGLAKMSILGEVERGYANLAFLICSNATTLTAFSPLVRGAKQNEHALPWVVWACAYTVLGIATYAKEGFWTELMIYPVLNAVFHASVAWLARARHP